MRLIGSFCVYRVPVRPLGPALRSFCFSLGSLGLSLGRLGAPLGRLGAHFGAPGAALGCLGDALGPLRDTLGSMLACLGIILGHSGILVSAGTPIASRWLSSTAPAHKNKPPGICSAVPVVPAVPGMTAKRSTNNSSGPTLHTRRGSG